MDGRTNRLTDEWMAHKRYLFWEKLVDGCKGPLCTVRATIYESIIVFKIKRSNKHTNHQSRKRKGEISHNLVVIEKFKYRAAAHALTSWLFPQTADLSSLCLFAFLSFLSQSFSVL